MAAVATVSKARCAHLLFLSRCGIRNFSTSLAPNLRILRSQKPFTSPNLHFPFSFRPFSANPIQGDRIVRELLAEVEREKQLEREERKKKGLEPLEDEDEDYMGVGPLIEKLERRKAKEPENIEQFWEPTDSDSDEDDERYSAEEIQRNMDIFEQKCKRHGEMLKNFAEAGIASSLCHPRQ